MIKIPPWSYSFLRDLDNCDLKAFRRYVVKDTPFIETPETKYGNDAHATLAERLRTGRPLPERFAKFEPYCLAVKQQEDQGKTLLVEKKLGIKEDGKPCSFFDDDVWGRTVIDIALFETGVQSATAVILDWKTGKRREDADELEIQSLILKAHHPNLEQVTGRYIWLADAKALGPAHDLSDWPVKLASIRNKVEKIRHNMRFSTWLPNENALCKWCTVFDCAFNRNKETKDG